MAENEIVKQEEYQTQFTKENILSLKDSINAAINKHAEEKIEGGKIDLFVILASLGQAAYEVIIRTFPRDQEEAQKAIDEMKLLTDKMIHQLDETRKDLQTKAISELLSCAHTMSIVSEFYARRRDEYIQNLYQNVIQKDDQTNEVGE